MRVQAPLCGTGATGVFCGQLGPCSAWGGKQQRLERECRGLPETRGYLEFFAGFQAAQRPLSAVSSLGNLDVLILLELGLRWRISG